MEGQNIFDESNLGANVAYFGHEILKSKTQLKRHQLADHGRGNDGCLLSWSDFPSNGGIPLATFHIAVRSLDEGTEGHPNHHSGRASHSLRNRKTDNSKISFVVSEFH